MADPVKYRIDVVEFDSLNVVKSPPKVESEGEGPSDTSENGQHLAKHGTGGRADGHRLRRRFRPGEESRSHGHPERTADGGDGAV